MILLSQWNRLVDFHSSIYMSTCHQRDVFWPTLQGHSSFTMLVQEEEKSTAKTWSSEQSIFGTGNSSNITTEGRNTLLLDKGLLQLWKLESPTEALNQPASLSRYTRNIPKGGNTLSPSLLFWLGKHLYQTRYLLLMTKWSHCKAFRNAFNQQTSFQ